MDQGKGGQTLEATCIHSAFEQQSLKTPESIAVEYVDQQISYHLLNCRANQLAHYLRESGVGPETAVAVLLDSCAEMVVTLLAVLKAGAAYVPLDPEYPSDRLEYILRDTRAAFILTKKQFSQKVSGSTTRNICLDSHQYDISRRSDTSSDAHIDSQNLAYIIYTSGSSGKPKGVQVTHRSLVHSTHARLLYYGIESRRFLLLSSFAFDSSLAGIFGTLIRGGTLVLTPRSAHANLTEFGQLIAEHRISELLCVPSLYRLLLDQVERVQLECLRVAIVAGESCPPKLVELHYRLLPHVELFNEYGPTEAAVWSTVYKCLPQLSQMSVPIGNPIPGTRLHVLDSEGTPVDVGTPGELFIGGPGLARGYVNQPGKTAEQFVPDPFSGNSGERLYRTGDWVRILQDGSLDFLGRIDEQLKIRGYRIEPGEIEAVLLQQNGVTQAVIVAREDQAGENRLVGYVVRKGRCGKVDALRKALEDRLPAYMVPSVLIELKQLPLTQTGKCDKRALPAPPSARPALDHPYAAPRNRTELELIRIWERCLAIEPIGIYDNVFQLGATSLTALVFANRLRAALGITLPLSAIYEAPTVKSMSDLMQSAEFVSAFPVSIIPLRHRIATQRARDSFFFVHPVTGFALCYLQLSRAMCTEHPFYGLQSPRVELATPKSEWTVHSIESLAERYVHALKVTEPHGPYHLGGWSFGGVVALEMARQMTKGGDDIKSLALIDTILPNSSGSERRPATVIPAQDDAELLAKLFLGDASFLPADNTDQRLAALLRNAVFQSAFSTNADISWARRIAALVREHASAELQYIPLPYQGRVVLFEAECDIEAVDGNCHRQSALFPSGAEVCLVPGNHYSIIYGQGPSTISQWYRRTFAI
jgi:amino acid adenylation domain-containing protein